MFPKTEPFRPNMSKLNESVRTRSLVDATGQQTLQLSQREINFVNTQVNELYQISFTIRNVSPISQKIKIKKPVSTSFTLQTSRQGPLAAGLDMKVTLIFDSKENHIIKDKIVIFTDSSQIEIPLNVYPNAGKLQFEPFINFGFVKTGTTKAVKWEIANKAENPLKIKLQPLLSDKTAKLTLSEQEINLEGGEKRIITISLASSISGLVEGSIEIEPKGINYSILEFTSNFCDFNRLISDSQGKQLHQVILQPLFGGQAVSASSFIVNNTPQACQFKVTRKKGAGGDQSLSLATPEQVGRDDSQKLVQFTPSQGQLEAYSSNQLKSVVTAKYQQSDFQLFCNYILGKNTIGNFQRDWTYTLRVYLNHDENHLDLPIKGTSLVPKLAVTPTYLSFSNTPLQQKQKKSIKIQNFSTRNIQIQFQSTANYSFHPQKLKIASKQSTKIQVTFSPKIMGQLNQICCLNAGVFSFPIKLLGRGVFGHFKAQSQNMTCQEVPIQGLQGSILQQQISVIQKQRNSVQPGLNLDISKNSIHFDTYRHAPSSIISEQKSLHQQNQKKVRIIHNKNGKQLKIDLNHLSPNQVVDIYSSVAKNQQQQRLISRQLTSHQLRNIQVGPVVIDFGTIFLRSSKKKYFHICNFNQKPISIKLETNHLSFAETSEERQILPAESHGGFTIAFEALSQGPFKYMLQYVLNSCHFFDLMITGTCITPTLNLSRNDIKFTINDQDRKFQKKQTLKLENNYDYDVSFQWKTLPNSPFSLEPASATIKANSFLMQNVIYNFEGGSEWGVKIQEPLKLKIKYGKQLEVKCSAFIPQSQCICKAQQIQFKQVAVGRICDSKILVKNMSKITTIYKIVIPKQFENILTIPSKTGSINAQEMVELVFRLNSLKTMTLDGIVQVMIRGSKPIELPARANVILPQVHIDNQLIDFGCVPVEGNPAQKEVTLTNESNIQVDIELRLHYDTFLAKNLKLCTITDSNLALVETKESKNFKTLCLRINPKCKANFTLQLIPETADEYQFYLPLFIPNTEPLQNLQRRCICKGIKNRLMALSKQVNFGKTVIQQSQQIYNKNQILQIYNPQEDPVNWWIEESGLAPFRVDKKSGRLQPFQKCPIKIFFSADTSGQYVRELQFFIDQVQTDICRSYMKVQVSASACYPTLYFDQPYLILPTVRCGQLSTSILQIFNGGYQNINLKHTITQEYSNVDLRVKYLTGSNLGVTKKQIKVEVSFLSDKPTSFTIKLNFYDNNGRFFSINVSGTADTHTYTMIQQDRGNVNWASNLQKSCQFLRHYINNTGHLTEQLYEFPKSLIQNEYQKFAIILNNYSPAFQKVKQQVKKNCRTFFSFQYVSQIIKILKSEGGFLNHIRPQVLLSYQQYLQNIKIRAQENQTVMSYYKTKDKTQFQLQQKQCWLILFYQLFKVFSRINPGKLKNNCQFWVKFNAREKIIINWLQKAYLSEAGIDLQCKDGQILSTLNSCEIFSALISKYTSIKILECYGKGIKSQKQKQRRCKSIIDTFLQIGINCLFRLQDLLRSNEKQMLLVLQNLYLILPSYLQKGDPIVFSCQFGQIVTKSVEITNPSKYQLTYKAKIEGSKAYSVQGESEFVIESKKTHEVKIKYISNINLTNSPATLTLNGKASNKFTPSTFVFLLKSNNQGRISEKTVQVTGNLYEQLDFSIKVVNNFDQDGDFKVQMQSNQKNLYQAFYLLSNSIKIKKGESVPLNLIFIPFSLDPQQILLVFRDEKVGQFQYQVNGLIQSNIICQEVLRVPQTLFTNKKYTIQLAIPTRNDLLLRARKAAQYLAQKLQKKITAKDPKQTFAPLNYDKYYPKLSNAETFTVKLTTPNNSIMLRTDQIVIKDIDLADDPAKKEEQKLAFDINLKSAIKEGSFTVNLKNIAGTDIRKYKVTLNAVARPLRYELEMKTPANKLITQPLPLINLSQQKNLFHVTLTPANDISRAAFSIDCERETIVEAKQQNIVNLSFKPRLQNIYNAILKIQNITTGQNVQYEIIGFAEEPQTESLLFEQEVRKQKCYSVKLPITKLTRCTVQSFTIQQATYQKAFQCAADNPYFKFKITPKMSGKIEGKLIIEAQQMLLAYKVIINVKNTIEGEIKLRTTQRKQVQGEISLPKGRYRVVSQDRNLNYPQTLQINEDKPSLKFGYYSSKPQEKQILVTIFGDEIGQLTYLIKVIVDPMPEIKFQLFQVQLGKTHRELVVFQNTDAKEMIITSKSSHPNIFFAQNEVLKVSPHSKSKNWIVYKASSLQIEEGKIFFASDGNAKWTYHLSGYGLPQTQAEVKELTVMMGEHFCEPITFCNPLNKTLPFLVTLENIEGESAFSTILKSSKIDLAYNQQMQIPVTVKPETVNLNTAILKISINEKVFWRYQLRAKTIYHSVEELKVFKMPARSKVEQPIELTLPFSKNYNGRNVDLSIVNAGEASDVFVKGAIKVAGGSQAVVLSQKVVFGLIILSYKPKTITTNFQVCAQNGCKWVYKVKFIFLAPPVDDQFQIAAAINKPASVKFRLTNRVKTYAKFHAYFTSDSCIDFSVNPKNGELQPYGREGTSIEVVFCPTQYKKSWVGKLIIQTEESYWSYEVHGVLPHYNPPVGKSTLKQA